MKNTKIILFASLIMAMILPFSSMDTAEAQEQTRNTYDPIVTQYLESVIYEPNITQQKIVDNQTITITTQSNKNSDGKYKLQSNMIIDGNELSSELFVITVNEDGTYRLVNDSNGIDETFTDEKPDRVKRGTGHSTSQKAQISLHDKKYGTPNSLVLVDNYSGCISNNKGEFKATVKPKLIDVTWDANPTYFHYCLVPLFFDSGVVQYGADKYYLTSGNNQADRRSSHAFTNESVGTTWYSVSVDFKYKPING